MSFFGVLLVGLIAGWLAGRIMRSRAHGLGIDLVVGLIGAMLGGWVFGLLGLAATSPLGTLVTATVGAVALIAMLRAWGNRPA